MLLRKDSDTQGLEGNPLGGNSIIQKNRGITMEDNCHSGKRQIKGEKSGSVAETGGNKAEGGGATKENGVSKKVAV